MKKNTFASVLIVIAITLSASTVWAQGANAATAAAAASSSSEGRIAFINFIFSLISVLATAGVAYYIVMCTSLKSSSVKGLAVIVFWWFPNFMFHTDYPLPSMIVALCGALVCILHANWRARSI